MLPDRIKGACDHCANQRTCQAPCVFVEKYLELKNRKPIERDFRDIITILFSDGYQIRECEFSVYDESGEPLKSTAQVFSDENPGAFMRGSDSHLKQTGIFIDRFFYRKGFEQLAEKYETSVHNAECLYSNARKRLMKMIEAMDRVEVAKKNGDAMAKLPKSVKIFLLHTAMGLSNGEICKLFGIKHNLVHQYISTVRDKLATGAMSLIDFTPDERRAAEERIKARKEIQKILNQRHYQKRKQAKNRTTADR